MITKQPFLLSDGSQRRSTTPLRCTTTLRSSGRSTPTFTTSPTRTAATCTTPETESRSGTWVWSLNRLGTVTSIRTSTTPERRSGRSSRTGPTSDPTDESLGNGQRFSFFKCQIFILSFSRNRPCSYSPTKVLIPTFEVLKILCHWDLEISLVLPERTVKMLFLLDDWPSHSIMFKSPAKILKICFPSFFWSISHNLFQANLRSNWSLLSVHVWNRGGTRNCSGCSGV